MSTMSVNTILPFSEDTVNVNGVRAISNNGSIQLTGARANSNICYDSVIIGVGAGIPLEIGGGSGNVLIGRSAGQSVLLGYANVYIGNNAGSSNNTGFSNVCIGNSSGALNTGGEINTFIGSNAGIANTTGSGNICVGYDSQTSTSDANFEVVLGNSNITVLRCQQTSITSLSDARDKKDIKDLSAGLSFVKTLKPVEFVWNDRDENGRRDIKDFGFIAQDLKASQEEIGLEETLKLVYESNPDKLEASYGKLVPILVKAIQELTAKVEELEKNNK